MFESQSLPAAVKALEDKAKEHKQAQNTEYHVSVARHNISQINDELTELEDQLRDLKYYRTVLEDAFDATVPSSLTNAVKLAKKAANVTQDELLEHVQTQNMSANMDLDESSGGRKRNPKVALTPEVKTQIKQIRSAKKQVKNITERMESKLKSKRDAWTTKISTAEELQKILGTQTADFARILNNMQQLLTRDLMDTSGSARTFVNKWDRATSNWEKHQSLQSFDDFRDQHGLSESTIEEIKTLSRSQTLTLADVSLDSLKEMKEVDELGSAVELSL
jgi:predicted  nucleic acid-binding Zn-ribbon protein